jgi:ABC-type Fe3+/spermidine/putrescine transport system ATPase subunit
MMALNPNGCAFGEAVQLALRPESIHVSADGAALALGRNAAAGIIEDVSFFGAETRVSVRLGTMLIRATRASNRDGGNLAPGQRVQLSWAAEDSVLVRSEPS